MNSFVAFFAVLAVANAGLIAPSANVLQGPSSRTTLVGPEGSVISSVAPGGQVITEQHSGYAAHAAPAVVAHTAYAAAPAVVAHSAYAAAPAVVAHHAPVVAAHHGVIAHSAPIVAAHHAPVIAHHGAIAHHGLYY